MLIKFLVQYFSQLETAKHLITNYRHHEPLHSYLKFFFKQNKKYGSRDRKLISSLCYNYYRLGQAFDSENTIDFKILLGYFLVQQASTPFLEVLKPEWNIAVNKSTLEKLAIAGINANFKIFTFDDKLSEEVDAAAFNSSFLHQPKLYIRIRPGFNTLVIEKLQASGLAFEIINNTCLAFSNATKIEDILDVGREVIIQDKNSQETGNIFKKYVDSSSTARSLWDCCAGSGGKSIMAYDLNNTLAITATDKRLSILKNLDKRFKEAGIKNYSSFIADLETIIPSDLTTLLDHQSFDVVIADVPCTGSGTWARTPEDLYFFKKERIKKYVHIQQQVIKKSVQLLKDDGVFIYVTCSVFKQENEGQVEVIKNEGLKLLQSLLLKGYHEQADTLFIAIFQK